MFSKISLILILGVALNVIAQDQIANTLNKFNIAKEKCLSETTPENLDKALKEKNFPSSMNCFVGCVAVEWEWLTSDGGFNKAHFEKALENSTPDQKLKIEPLMNKIKQAVGDIVGKCDAGAKLLPIANELAQKTH